MTVELGGEDSFLTVDAVDFQSFSLVRVKYVFPIFLGPDALSLGPSGLVAPEIKCSLFYGYWALRNIRWGSGRLTALLPWIFKPPLCL